MSSNPSQPKLTVSQRLAKAENMLMDVGEILSQLKFEQEQLEKGTAPKPAASPTTTQPKPATPTTAKRITIEDVKAALPADIVTKIDVAYREQGAVIIMKPIAFLGSDNFSKMASVSRNFGGEYISAGKDSHFKIKAVQGGQ